MNRLISQKLIDKIKKLFTSLWTDASGNVGIGGNLKVNGTIEPGLFSIDADIKDQVQANMPTNMNVNYAHIRESNRKLNIVISIWAEQGVAIAETIKQIFIYNLPTELLNKLIPFSGVRLSKQIVYGSGPTISNLVPIEMEMIKEETYLKANIYIPPIASTSTLSNWRFEFNFILS